MDASKARDILKALADGIDPHTGEVMGESSPYQHPQIVRALYTAIRQLERAADRESKTRKMPAMAGKAWTEGEDQQLIKAFRSGASLADLAKTHQRTRGAIQSRIERHGLNELRKTLGEPS